LHIRSTTSKMQGSRPPRLRVIPDGGRPWLVSARYIWWRLGVRGGIFDNG